LSGFESLEALQPFFSFNLSKTKKRFCHLTDIIFKQDKIDQCLMVFFPRGESYTNENVIELSVHGNQLNINRIIHLFINHSDFRHAFPGEFTYRALQNKKLSLSQVEGLDMLLNANSSLMLSQGLDILHGDLYLQYKALFDSFIKLKGAVEISIDFSDDVGADETKTLLNKSFNHFYTLISKLKTRTEGPISSLLSPEVVLVGQTNAGKSSLFNLILKHNRSIVSPIAGTTRDYVSEPIFIDGTNYLLIDTAGIRESDNVIETIGIKRGEEILARAFFRILIINPLETDSAFLNKFADIDFDLLIFSHGDQANFSNEISKINLSMINAKHCFKADLSLDGNGPIEPVSINGGPIEPVTKNSGPIEPVSKNSGPIEPVLKNSGPIEPVLKSDGPIEPSTKSSGPIEPLIKFHVSSKFKDLSSNNPILLERHRACINKIYLKASLLFKDFNRIDDVAILSSEVNLLGNDLSELVGIVSPDEVLNSIFANFCIGK
jgi:tRNA modification GTPase